MGNPRRVRAPRVREPVGLSVTGRVVMRATTCTIAASIARRCARASCSLVVRLTAVVHRSRAAPAAAAPAGASARRRRADAARHDQAVLRRAVTTTAPRRPASASRASRRRASASTPSVFEKAVRKMRGRVMPPPGARQPDAAAVDSLVALARDVARPRRRPGAPARPGRAAPAQSQGIRERGPRSARGRLRCRRGAAGRRRGRGLRQHRGGAAGVAVVHRAVRDRRARRGREGDGPADARPGGWTFRAGPGTQLTHVPGLPLGTRGGILANVDLPSDGEYVVDIADMATHIWGNGMEFENPLVVTLDNKVVYETVIGGEEDMKLYDQVQNGALDRVNARLKNIRFFATAGPHRIGVTFKRRTFAESDDQLQMFAPGGGQDRLYRVNSFQLRGPVQREGAQRRRRAASASSAASPAGGATADAQARCAQTDHRVAGDARLPAAGDRRGRQRAVRSTTRTARRTAASRAASAARSPACWRARSSCIAASASPPACGPATPTPSAISSWRRSCRSSSGTRFPTTSCCSSAIDGKLKRRRRCSTGRCGACSPIRAR